MGDFPEMDSSASFATWVNENRRLVVQVAISTHIIYGLCRNFVDAAAIGLLRHGFAAERRGTSTESFAPR